MLLFCDDSVVILISNLLTIPNLSVDIDISSQALKKNMVEVNTIFKFIDKEENKKKSYFEIVYATIVKINDEVKEKSEIEKLLLCDVQNKIYPNLEKALLNLLHNSGYTNIKFEKKVNFENLYNQRFN